MHLGNSGGSRAWQGQLGRRPDWGIDPHPRSTAVRKGSLTGQEHTPNASMSGCRCTLWAVASSQRPQAEADDHGGGGRRMSTRFIGGLNWSPARTASAPLATLWATTDSLTLSLRFGFGRWWGPWIVKPEEVAKIRDTGGKYLGSGVEFHLLDGRLLIFGTFHGEEVLHCLQQLGYPVTLPPS